MPVAAYCCNFHHRNMRQQRSIFSRQEGQDLPSLSKRSLVQLEQVCRFPHGIKATVAGSPTQTTHSLVTFESAACSCPAYCSDSPNKRGNISRKSWQNGTRITDV
ncbi:hypothetical protein RvY_01392 [Ramazzottius varieornatus]|uniref:Uncharacterized protein n=1 Tax=Ramazzottius varieornatus TaxID=947166 RepID=A0A1D1UK39_RAMVA|nr:hypothetical protein RvY_01392 [Ramazzottius varieornatus]